MKQVGRELGVRYVLEGSVRKGGNRVRITGAADRRETGAHLWADRFDGSLEDVFELQDKVASASPASSSRHCRPPRCPFGRAARPPISPPTTSICAPMRWSCRSARADPRGAASYWSRRSRAIRITGRHSPGRRSAAMRLVHDGGAEDPEADREGRRSRPAGPASGRGRSGHPGAMPPSRWPYFGEDIGAMMALVDRALALNPSFARGWHMSGILRLWAGQPDLAIEHIETCAAPQPARPCRHAATRDRRAHFFKRRFDEAVPKLLLAIQEDPSYPAAIPLFSPPAMPIWAGSTKRERSSPGCAPLPLVVDADASYLAEPRGPRAVPVGPAPGGRREAT